MNKIGKIFLATLAPMVLAVTSCSGNDPVVPDEPKGYFTEGREIDYIEGEKPVDQKFYRETYTNGTYPLDSAGRTYTQEVADPHIVKGDDGTLYMYATNRVALKSIDGCNWEVFSTNIIDRPTWGDEYAKGPQVWAPDVMKIGDNWIYYYSLSAWGAPVGIGYATAPTPEGPFEDQGKLFLGSELGIKNCIDPCIFREGNDVYMAVGSFQGLYLVELSEDGCSLFEPENVEDPIAYWRKNKTLIAGYDGDWDGSTYEGTYIVKRGEYYYLFGSAGTCCANKDSTYSVFVGRSESIEGPYVGKDKKPMTLSGHGTTNGELVLWAGSPNVEKNVYGPGHNSILVDDAGHWWMYYHGYFAADSYKTRHLLIDEINWDEDGFPYVGSTENGNFKRPSYDIELEGPYILEE